MTQRKPIKHHAGVTNNWRIFLIFTIMASRWARSRFVLLYYCFWYSHSFLCPPSNRFIWWCVVNPICNEFTSIKIKISLFFNTWFRSVDFPNNSISDCSNWYFSCGERVCVCVLYCNRVEICWANRYIGLLSSKQQIVAHDKTSP